MILILFCALFVQADPQVTLDLPAMRLPEVAKKISDRTGEQVKITGPDPGQFVFIKVEKMPFSRLRDSLSFVTGGKWTKAGEVWALQTASPADLRKGEIERMITAWLKDNPLQAALSPQEVKKLASTPTEEGQVKPKPWRARMPLTRLFNRVLRSVPLKALADVPPDGRVVYSLAPTSLQKALPASLQQDLATAEKESLAWSLYESQGQAMESPAFPEGANDRRDWLVSGASGPKARSLRLAVHDSDGFLNVTLQVFDSRGTSLGKASVFMPGFQSMSRRSPDGLSPLQDLLEKDSLCVMTQADDAFSHELTLAQGKRVDPSEPKVKIPEFLQSRLLGLATEDPTTWHPTTLLRQLSKTAGRQVVAKVDDIVFFMLAALSTDGLSTGRAVDRAFSLRKGDSHRIKVENDLICLAPSAFVSGGGPCADRQAIVDALKRSLQGAPLIDTLIDASLREPVYANMIWHENVDGLPFAFGEFSLDATSYAMFRFYGSLNESQRRAASLGQLALADLTGAQAREFEGFASKLSAGYLHEAVDAKPPLSEFEREPTVLLALTPPNATRIHLARRLRPVVIGLHKDEELDCEVDPYWMARCFQAKEDGDDFPPLPSCFLLSKADDLSLEVRVGARATINCSQEFMVVERSEPPILFDQLPEDFRKEVAKELERLRKEDPPTLQGAKRRS